MLSVYSYGSSLATISDHDSDDDDDHHHGKDDKSMVMIIMIIEKDLSEGREYTSFRSFRWSVC